MKICVLGAGVVGLASAWTLAEAGHDIILVDRQPIAAAEASAANGAQLSYAFVAPLASPSMLRKLPAMFFAGEDAIRVSFDIDIVRWGVEFLKSCTASAVERTTTAQLALAMLSRVELAQLTEAQGLSYGLRTAGKLVVFRKAGDFDAAQPGPRPPVPQQVLTPAECLALEPALKLKPSEIVGGVHTPSEQVGDCALFCAELFARLQRHDRVEIRMATPLSNPVLRNGRLVAIETKVGALTADLFVLSLGAGSKAFARSCGVDLPIYPVKGHSITVPGNVLSHSVTDYSRKIVYAPLGSFPGAAGTGSPSGNATQQKFEGATRVAGFADFKGYDTAVEADRIATLETAAFATFGIAHAGRSSPWAGLRPVTPDSRPIIGPSPVDGLFLNAGHGMLGWTLASGSARLAADLIDGKPPSCPAEPFALERF